MANLAEHYAGPAIGAAVGIVAGAFGGVLLGRRAARAPELAVQEASADQLAVGLRRRLGRAARRRLARLAGDLQQDLERAKSLD